jgi:hypothetical protein
MNGFKLQDLINQLEELKTHLDESQGYGLKERLDKLKNPISDPKSEGLPEELSGDKPKGIAIEKVSVLAKPKQGFDDKVNEAIESQDEKPSSDSDLLPGEEEMTDEELEELLKRIK